MAQQIYTIGGDAPDFESFNEAVVFLESSPLTETVIFEVRDGEYNERIVIPEIEGASEENQIVFRSELGVRENVVLYSDGASVVELDGVDWVRFEGMTIRVEGNSEIHNQTVFRVTDQSSNIVIDDCIIQESLNDNEEGIGTILLRKNQGFNNNSYLEVIGSNLVGGNKSIESTFGRIKIADCHFSAQRQQAIYFDDYSNLLIKDNTIEGGQIGIYFNIGHYQGEITNNIIKNANEEGIRFLGFDNFSSPPFLIQNNFISSNTSNAFQGIAMSYSQKLNFYHNTITIYGNNSSNSCIRIQEAFDNHVFRNNIFTNYGSGSVFRFPNGINTSFNSNYNNIYSSDNTPFQVYNNFYSLQEIVETFQEEVNSNDYPPGFENENSYYPRSTLLRNAGQSLSSPLFDIENNTRSNPPDLGVVEFEPPGFNNDYGLEKVDILPFGEGSVSVSVQLSNFGFSSFQNAEIQWTVNGLTQPVFNWSGDLNSGESEILNIGSFEADVPEIYTIEVTVSNANIEDDYAYNNTIRYENLRPGLAGDYFIGEESDEFQTISAAADYLRDIGVFSPVTFYIRSGIYENKIIIKNFVGMGEENPVVFTSASGNAEDVLIKLSTNGAGFILNFAGGQYITFSNLSFLNLTELDRTIKFENNSKNINIQNNIFSFTPDELGYYHIAASFSGNDANLENITISDNIFNYGRLGFVLYDSDNLKVYNNRFVDCVYAFRITDSKNTIIENNTIEDTKTTGWRVGGFVIQDFFENLTVSKNKMHNIRELGMYIEAGSQNHFLLLSNNYVSRLETDPDVNNDAVRIAYLQNSVIVHNTIKNEFTNGGYGTAIELTISGNNNLVKNNILIGNGSRNSAIYLSGYFPESSIDFNNYYTSEYFLIENYGTGPGSFSTLEEWQMITDFDDNSLSLDLIFDESGYRTFDATFDNLGTPIPEITTDIDGNPRDPNTPDIGAYEFSAGENDGGIIEIFPPTAPFEAGAHPINITLKNFGTSTITSATIEYSLNDNTPLTYDWTGELVSGATTTIDIPAITWVEAIPNTITACVVLVNHAIDEEIANSCYVVDKIYAGLNGDYSIGGANPNFETLSHSAEALKLGGVLGEVVFNIRDGVYTESLVFEDILGISQDNSVTYRSESMDSTTVTLKCPSGNFGDVIALRKASFFTFRGLGFEMKNNWNAIKTYGGVERTKIENCWFKSVENYLGNHIDFGNFIHGENNMPNNLNQISNNNIEGGYIGVSLQGIGDDFDHGNYIRNNTFSNQRFRGIYLYKQRVQLTQGNVFRGQENRVIDIFNCAQYVVIDRNQIFGTEELNCGIFIQDSGSNLPQPIYIMNNYLEITPSPTFYEAVNISNSTWISFLHNTLLIKELTESGSFRVGLKVDNPEVGLKIKNNIFVSETIDFMDLETLENYSEIDNNIFYGTQDNFGKFNNTSISTLQDWQQTTQLDLQSLFLDPQFDETIPYIVHNQNLRQPTVYLPETGGDIEDKERDTENPTAGAYEIPYKNDLLPIALLEPSLLCTPAYNVPIQIKIQNLGFQALSNFTVGYTINGISTTELVEATIQPSEELIYTFDTPAEFSDSNLESITIFTQYDEDGRPENDDLQVFLNGDIEAPIARCQNLNLTLPVEGSLYLSSSMLDAGSTDNCAIVQRFLSKSTLDCSDLGINNIYMAVVDGAGNQHSCNSIILLEEHIIPEINCVEFFDVELSTEENNSLTAEELALSASDNCTLAENLSFAFINGSSNITLNCNDLGTTSMEIRVTDEAGNQNSCMTELRVSDDDLDFCPCTDEEMVVNEIPPTSNTIFRAQDFIVSDATITNQSDVAFFAQNYVLLEENFSVDLGSEFLADIQFCYGSDNLLEMEERIQTSPLPYSEVDIKVRPNPFSEETIIEYTLLGEVEVSLFLYDAVGRLVKQPLIRQWHQTGQHQLILKRDHLKPGIYFLSMNVGEGWTKTKIVIF